MNRGNIWNVLGAILEIMQSEIPHHNVFKYYLIVYIILKKIKSHKKWLFLRLKKSYFK